MGYDRVSLGVQLGQQLGVSMGVGGGSASVPVPMDPALGTLYAWARGDDPEAGLNTTPDPDQYESIPNRGTAGGTFTQATSGNQPQVSTYYTLPAPAFDGVSRRIPSSLAASEWALLHDGTSQLTITIKTRRVATTLGAILSTGLGGAASRGIRLNSHTSGRIQFLVSSGSAVVYSQISGNNAFDPGEHVVQIVKDGTSITVYVDGTSTLTGTMSASSTDDPAHTLAIGSAGGDTSPYEGIIAEWTVHLAAHDGFQRAAMGAYLTEKWVEDTESLSAPLATDESIYGAIDEGAYYIFREPYITIDDGRVTAAVNVNDPGTRDLSFPTPPLWVSDGGPDGAGCIRFNGSSEYGVATGFSFSETAETNLVSLQVVARYLTHDDRNQVAVAIGAEDELEGATPVFLYAAHSRTFSTADMYRANGSLVEIPHNVDYLTPEASEDTVWYHLHETHAMADVLRGVYDGTIFDASGAGFPQTFGGGGMRGDAIDRLFVGRSGGSAAAWANIEIAEIVVTEGRSAAEHAAYRSLRVAAEYPSVDLAE
jgi:hypothetical protein